MNPHALALDPKSSASTSFATLAHGFTTMDWAHSQAAGSCAGLSAQGHISRLTVRGSGGQRAPFPFAEPGSERPMRLHAAAKKKPGKAWLN